MRSGDGWEVVFNKDMVLTAANERLEEIRNYANKLSAKKTLCRDRKYRHFKYRILCDPGQSRIIDSNGHMIPLDEYLFKILDYGYDGIHITNAFDFTN